MLEFTNHPVCAAKERDLFIEAQPPLLENGGEWIRLATNPSPPPRVATCRTVLKFDRVSLPLTIFVLTGRAEAFSQAEVGFDLRTEGPVSWELSLLRLCVLLVIGAAGIALSSVLYRKHLLRRRVIVMVPTVMSALFRHSCDVLVEARIKRLGLDDHPRGRFVNVPGLATAVSLNAIMPQSVVPPWSYIAAAVAFWLGWFFFGRVVRWWSKPE